MPKKEKEEKRVIKTNKKTRNITLKRKQGTKKKKVNLSQRN